MNKTNFKFKIGKSRIVEIDMIGLRHSLLSFQIFFYIISDTEVKSYEKSLSKELSPFNIRTDFPTQATRLRHPHRKMNVKHGVAIDEWALLFLPSIVGCLRRK